MDDRKTDRVTSLIETWAGHFGSVGERRKGSRRVQFEPGIRDVADQVSLCLEMLPIMAEFVAERGLGERLANGYLTLTTLLAESAQKIIEVLDDERGVLERQNATLSIQQGTQSSGLRTKYDGAYGRDKVLVAGSAFLDTLAVEQRESLMCLVGEAVTAEQIAAKVVELGKSA